MRRVLARRFVRVPDLIAGLAVVGATLCALLPLVLPRITALVPVPVVVLACAVSGAALGAAGGLLVRRLQRPRLAELRQGLERVAGVVREVEPVRASAPRPGPGVRVEPQLDAAVQAFDDLVDALRGSRRLVEVQRRQGDALLMVDPDGRILYECRRMAQMLGRGSMVGESLLRLVHPDEQDSVRDQLAAAQASTERSERARMRLRHADGSWRHLGAAMVSLLDEPSVQAVVVSFRDVTEQVELEEELAGSDSLTGLANRRVFLDRLRQELRGARRSMSAPTPSTTAVLLLDLDDFRALNDSLGPAAGDLYLQITARRLSDLARRGDTTARLGGDQFAVLMRGVADEHAAETAAVRLQRALCEAVPLHSLSASVGVSIGLALAEPDSDALDLLQRADVALSTAKRRGGGVVERYCSTMREQARQRFNVRSDLNLALERGELFCVYQPIVDLETGRVAGVESLLRWQHPERGLVAPLDFVPLAEELGLIERIGHTVLQQSCEAVRSWRRAGHRDLYVSVNVSALQLRSVAFVDELAAQLAASRLPGDAVMLELTESVVMDGAPHALQMLQRLKELGVRLALDDFGTGYSSLAYLRQFPIDVLKIDRSFVTELGQGRGELAGAIVELARSLHLQTVAEGIEEATEADGLAGLGCRFGQGYRYSRPVPGDELLGLLDTRFAVPGAAEPVEVRS